MPIIKRITLDMFEFADVMCYMVNPVNLVAAPGAGLALEFRKRVPNFYEPYRAACLSKELRIGTIQLFEETDHPWSMINLPTKRHYQDTSSPDDIARGLEALRDLLNQDRYRYSSVGIPMLGTGLGTQDYPTIYPLMMDYLGNLDTTVFLSMSPARTEMRPKYLTIVGPLDYGRDDTEKKAIDWGIQRTLEAWGTKLEDYEGIVSGGYPGVDMYVCGEHYNKDYHDTYVYRHTQKVPLVVKPNKVRNGLGANLHLGNLLGEIGDDVILFKPKGHNNNRMSAMQIWLQVKKEQQERDGLFPKRVAIFGEKDTTPEVNNLIIPLSLKDQQDKDREDREDKRADVVDDPLDLDDMPY